MGEQYSLLNSILVRAENKGGYVYLAPVEYTEQEKIMAEAKVEPVEITGASPLPKFLLLQTNPVVANHLASIQVSDIGGGLIKTFPVFRTIEGALIM